ncbi:MAG: hypothetical protein ACRD0G_17045, partial [Acidimicrobiales bacterium]
PPAADADGDGCREPVVIVDGEVRVGSRRFAVGQPGDQLVAGDWECDGDATVAVLRPATGEVFVFDGWSSAGGELSVAPVTTVDEPVTLVADDPEGDGCHTLVAVSADGSRREVLR